MSLSTRSIVNRLPEYIRAYSKRHPNEIEGDNRYKAYHRVRERHLNELDHSYERLLASPRFCSNLREVLKLFQMDQRGSRLISPREFQTVLIANSFSFQQLHEAGIVIQSLALHERQERAVYQTIGSIYDSFSGSNQLSESGGMVIASKTMHMIMPELFIMIDGQVMGTLHDVADYQPSPRDGGTWYEVIPGYDGRKLNPFDRYSWDDKQCYAAALMYSKRIINEWLSVGNNDLNGLYGLDPGSSLTRLIDKALR